MRQIHINDAEGFTLGSFIFGHVVDTVIFDVFMGLHIASQA